MVTIARPSTSPATAPTRPPTPTPGRPATNDLFPDDDIDNCIGTVERANCGSKARADGHTYLVFLALAAGLAFIGWRIARGVTPLATTRPDQPTDPWRPDGEVRWAGDS